jgi:hypothetical protein
MIGRLFAQIRSDLEAIHRDHSTRDIKQLDNQRIVEVLMSSMS